MIDEYVPMDRRPNDFYERFMEQRIQQLNNPEHSDMEASLPFSIEPLRTAPVPLPPIRVSNTSSDSGVNSPHALSPAKPITPDNSRPHLIPSTSRMNLPSGPLTPVQQFKKIAANLNRRSQNTIVPNPFILTHSRCFVLALDTAIKSRSSMFYMIFYASYSAKLSFSELNGFL